MSLTVLRFPLLMVCFFVCEGKGLVKSPLKAPSRPQQEYSAVARRGLCTEGGGDKDAGCGYWKELGYCEPGMGYDDFMGETCPATCGLCQVRPTASPSARAVEVDMEECLEAHNSKRAMHGAKPLTWDTSLAKKAKTWALHLANEDVFEHAPWSGAGENLYYVSSVGKKRVTCKDAVKAWYDEVSDYPFMDPPNSIFDVTDAQIGHFTQIVWKSTREVGVGIATIKRGFWTKTYVVARYTPPGNYEGRFKDEVGSTMFALK